MAQNNKPAAKPADPTAPPKSSKKMMLIIIAVLTLGLAGGAGWYFTKGKDDGTHAEEVKVAPPKTPIFVPLEQFVVNLQREHTDQYLQLGITLKLFDAEIDTKIKANLPEIRSRILQLLTTKTATELLTAEGKTQLVKEIITMSNSVIGVTNLPPPAIVAAALPVAAPAADPAQPAAAVAAPAPVAVPAKPAEPQGIVDVLFTSFIIQ